MGKVPGNALLIVAGIIWFIAGANVAALGVQAYFGFSGLALLWLGLGALAVFLVFLRMFRRLVAKHTQRILGYANERTSVLKFFDARGYLIMAIMMGCGFGLRALGVFPQWFIAFFYTGLGCALALCGILFCRNYLHNRTAQRNASQSQRKAG